MKNKALLPRFLFEEIHADINDAPIFSSQTEFVELAHSIEGSAFFEKPKSLIHPHVSMQLKDPVEPNNKPAGLYYDTYEKILLAQLERLKLSEETKERKRMQFQSVFRRHTMRPIT